MAYNQDMDIRPPDARALAEMLGKVSHFQNLSPAELGDIISTGVIQIYRKGVTLFSEDEPSAGLFVLLSGQVQLCKVSRQGKISILAVFNPVHMFNETPALDGGPNPVTVIATLDSTTWHISGQELQDLILQHPRIGLGLLQMLAQRNRRLVVQFQDLSFRTVQARSAKLLLELSENGTVEIDRRLHPNHQLAARISTVPEAFSRSLQIFKREGCLAGTPRCLKILQTEKLMRVAEIDENH